MNMGTVFSSTGLILDIIGAYLLAKGVFFENIQSIVDKGYILSRNNPDTFYGVDRISKRCDEVKQTYYGLVVLCLGFSFQLIGQYFQRVPVSCQALLWALLFFVVTLLSIRLIVSYFDEKNRRNSALELVDRMCYRYCSKRGILFLPSGLSLRVIETIANTLLKRKLPFNSFDNIEKIKERTPLTWLQFEIKRRYGEKQNDG